MVHCDTPPFEKREKFFTFEVVKFRNCFEIIDEKIYEDFSRQFHVLKKEHSGCYVTDERQKNG